MAADPDLLSRIDRLESLDAIRQLAARYCLALDMRALDALVNLFPADVRVSRDASGRQALRAWFDETLRVQFTGTAHVTGNHIIEFDDADHAHGVVYSRNEHETGDEWVIMTMMYWDHYERIRRQLVFPPPAAALLVCHRPEQAADRRAQDALARPGSVRRRVE